MATRGGRPKTSLTPFYSLTPNTPVRRKHLGDISYTSRVMAVFVSNFVAMATGVIRDKLKCYVKLAVPKNHTLEPKIITLSCVQLQPELLQFTEFF